MTNRKWCSFKVYELFYMNGYESISECVTATKPQSPAGLPGILLLVAVT
jgi:hypothetical protein